MTEMFDAFRSVALGASEQSPEDIIAIFRIHPDAPVPRGIIEEVDELDAGIVGYLDGGVEW